MKIYPRSSRNAEIAHNKEHNRVQKISFAIPGAKPLFRERVTILKDIRGIIDSGRLIYGEHTKRFENSFRRYIGTKHAVAVNSCTTALQITLQHIDVRNKEVITPTNTFIATPNAVLYAGGKPVLVDVRADNFCIDVDEVRKKINKNTKAVIAVHIAGMVCPQIEELRELCEKHGLYLVEDCAHSVGAMINGKKSGSLGYAGCFSFYPTKIMTTGTGGMITTDDNALAEKAVSLRHHGQGKSLEDIINLGNDWAMNEISAVLGFYQLKHLEESIGLRNNIARIFDKELNSIKGIDLIPVPKNIRHVYYKYPFLLNSFDRDAVRNALKEKYDIEAGILYYPPCHLQPVYRKMFSFSERDFPVASSILKKQLCFPMYDEMNEEDASYMVESLKKELK